MFRFEYLFPPSSPLMPLFILSVLAVLIVLLKTWQLACVKESASVVLKQFRESSDLAEAKEISQRLEGGLAKLARIGFELLETPADKERSFFQQTDYPEGILKLRLEREIKKNILILKSGLTLLLCIGCAGPVIGYILSRSVVISPESDTFNIPGFDIYSVFSEPLFTVFVTTTAWIGITFFVFVAYFLFLHKTNLSRKKMEAFAADFVQLSRQNQFKYRKHLDTAYEPALSTELTVSASGEKHSYGQILKSSAMVGGSSVVNIGIGIVRTKAMAVLLGPAGVGLMGLYGSIADLTQSVAGMGINNSGVRQIAEAVGSDDIERVARTAAVLRRTAILLAVAGAIFLVGASPQVSSITFGDDSHTIPLTMLSLAVFFQILSDGQTALLNGMRRIGDLAKIKIFGALFGTMMGIPLVYFFREDGVVPSLVAVAAMSLTVSWWYRRKLTIPTPSLTTAQVGQEQAALLKLGFAFMSSGIMMMGVTYAVRILVLRNVGFEAAGLYQSAWALGGLYVGIVLQAMGADFYPRLTAVAHNNSECNRLVNEQAQISLLLAGPGVIATLTFAPLVIAIFYTPQFYAAVDVLRWLCLGMTLRIISWPMGFIIVAKGAQSLFFWSELAWTIVYISLAWGGVISFGLDGAGMAFFGSYIFHCVLIYLIVRKVSGFRWSSANIRTAAIFLTLIAVIFVGFYFLPPLVAMILGILAVVLSCIYTIHTIVRLVSLERIPRPVRQLFALLHLLPSN